MKRTLILLALLAPFLLKAQTGAYTVHGKTELRPDNGLMNLLWFNINSGKHADSSLVDAKGNFGFKGTMKSPELGQLLYLVNGVTQSAVFYLEPGNINIFCTAHGRYPQLSGTPNNNDFNQYYTMMGSMLDSVKAANPGNQHPYTQFSKEVNPQKLQILRKMIKAHPGSLLCLYQLNVYASKAPDVLIVDELYKQLSPEVRKTTMGLELALKIKGMASGKVGDTALDFSLPDTQGKAVKLSDFKGKYVLLDFWATWCGPCLAEMPNVANAYQKYKDKNFTILGVSLDRPDSKVKWQKMIVEQNLNWVQVSDLKWWNSQAALLYDVNSVPANFLIDPNGKIIGKNLRGEELQKKLAELFKGSVN